MVQENMNSSRYTTSTVEQIFNNVNTLFQHEDKHLQPNFVVKLTQSLKICISFVQNRVVPFIPPLDLVLFYGLPVKLYERTSFQTLKVFPVLITVHYISLEHSYKLEHILTSQKTVFVTEQFLSQHLSIYGIYSHYSFTTSTE